LEIAHFIIKNKFQKGGRLYQYILTPKVLQDICLKATGQTEFTCEFDNNGYNKGRLAILLYKEEKVYISLSEDKIQGRNSSFQSFPTALSQFILDQHLHKKICFYFLPAKGNYQTEYFNFMYRLMKTANVILLNEDDHLSNSVQLFNTLSDIVINKDRIRSKNSGNRSTYITHGINNKLQIFGKTYGASKYETTILCMAISSITTNPVELYEIEEGGLTKLPQTSRDAIEKLGNIQIFTSNRTLERENFDKGSNLRSPEYTYNLLAKLGDKKCAFCECDIPNIIQGAHIWPVADIKKENHLTEDEKLSFALDGENGLWLCQNHHKLFDTNILLISQDGSIQYKKELPETANNFINDITKYNQLNEDVLTDKFIDYLDKRNEYIYSTSYVQIGNS